MSKDFSSAFEAYNALAADLGWPKALKLSPTRKSKLAQRLRDGGGIDGWRDAMAKARASGWLNGTTPRSEAFRNWVPDLDFFLQESSFTKLIEGRYDERPTIEPPRKSRILSIMEEPK